MGQIKKKFHCYFNFTANKNESLSIQYDRKSDKVYAGLNRIKITIKLNLWDIITVFKVNEINRWEIVDLN